MQRRSDQRVMVNHLVTFNGKLSSCQVAYDFMADHSETDEEYCKGAQEALARKCCSDDMK